MVERVFYCAPGGAIRSISTAIWVRPRRCTLRPRRCNRDQKRSQSRLIAPSAEQSGSFSDFNCTAGGDLYISTKPAGRFSAIFIPRIICHARTGSRRRRNSCCSEGFVMRCRPAQGQQPLTSVMKLSRGRWRTCCPSCVRPYLVRRGSERCYCPHCMLTFALIEETSLA